MKRRDALKNMGLAAGGSFVLSTTLFSGCQSDQYQPKFFTKEEVLLLHEIGETILPETKDSPGAKVLKVGNFIDTYVADCYSLENQQLVQEGLVQLQEQSQGTLGNKFEKLNPEQRHNYLIQLDSEAKESDTAHYFSLLKSLVLFAYFTSEAGATQALNYLPIPGKYDGNYPYQEGDKAWAI